jgi:hypothetical protein
VRELALERGPAEWGALRLATRGAAQSRRTVDGTDVDFNDDEGGDVFGTCGEAGGSASSMVNGGRGTALSRSRLVGAKTPCRAFIPDRVDFAAQPDHRDVIEVLNAFGHAHATVC